MAYTLCSHLRQNLLDLLRLDHQKDDRNGPRNFWRWVTRQPWRQMLPSEHECFSSITLQYVIPYLHYAWHIQTCMYIRSVQGHCGASRCGFRRDVQPWQMANILSLRSVLWFLHKLGPWSFAHNPCTKLAYPSLPFCLCVCEVCIDIPLWLQALSAEILGGRGCGLAKTLYYQSLFSAVDLCHQNILSSGHWRSTKNIHELA